MKKNQSIAVLGVLTSTILVGCDAALDVASPPSGQNPQSDAMSMRMPKSLQAADSADTTETDESASTADTPAAAQETVKEVESVANSLDAAVAGSSSQALYLGAEMLTERLEIAREALQEIDGVWTQISAYCESVASGSNCEIPAGTLTLEGDEASDTQTLETAIVYQRNPDDTYAHSVVTTWNDEFSETEQIRWNDDRSLIAMNFSSTWSDEAGTGSQSSDLQYVASDSGDRISSRDEFMMGQEKFTDIQQLHQLNDGLNGVEMMTEFSWSDGYTSGRWQSQAVANDEGGKLVTTTAFDDEDTVWHARETFDGKGKLVSSEHCEQMAGIDCSDPANWRSEEIDYDDQGFEFDIEAAGEDLEIAYEMACAAMEIDEQACGFSDLEMTVLEGALDIFDNTQDVTIYLCVETGEDEMACQAQHSPSSSNAIDGEAGYGDEWFYPEAGEAVDGGFITEADCEDCEPAESVTDSLGIAEAGDWEEVMDLLNSGEFEIVEIDQEFDEGEAVTSVFECDDNVERCIDDDSDLEAPEFGETDERFDR